MEVSITARPDGEAARQRLDEVLATMPERVVACSGGIDSLLLAVVAHDNAPNTTVIAHTVTPAVPGDGTARVVDYAERRGWNLNVVRSGEFDDESYLSNPTDRCYHCKKNLYGAVDALRPTVASGDVVVMSGANLDDLGEYRPGLIAAEERGVRHPYVEAHISKLEIRAIARDLGLADADLAASPCLASRLYTGTRVTPSRLRAIEAGEALVRQRAAIDVVRCRVDDDSVLIEVEAPHRHLITAAVVNSVANTMQAIEPTIARVALDTRDYAPGRAIVASER